MTDTWEDDGGPVEQEIFDEPDDWPYDEDWEDEENLLEQWDDLDEIDDWKYVEDR